MKKRLILTAVVLVALTITWTAFAARGGGAGERAGGRGGFGGPAGVSAEEREKMRERFQNMSEEERQKFREQMRARFENISDEERAQMRQRFTSRTRLSTEDQLKAIKAMQGQLTKLKAAIEAAARPQDRTSFRDMSEEDRAKLRESMTKSREARQASIVALRAEIDKLSPPRPTPEQMAALAELREIRVLAEKEKAAQTTKRLAALIAKQTQLMGGRRGPGAPGAPGEGRQRGQRGAGTGTPRRPAREGGGTQ